MGVLINLLTVMLPLLYGLAAVNYQVYFIRSDAFAERTVTPFLAGVVTLDWVYLLLRIFHYRHFPLTTLGEALSLIALAVAATYLYVERVQENKATGAFIISMVVLVQLVASALLTQGGVPRHALLTNTLLGVHTVMAVLGYSAFAVGAVYGVMYLLLYRALKRKSFGLIFQRLPSLDVLAKMAFGATLFGFFFLTATILLGIPLALHLYPNFYKDPKIISSLVVWGIYALYVATYFLLGWRGARSVYLGLVGFVFAVVAMFGSAFLWPSFHSFVS